MDLMCGPKIILISSVLILILDPLILLPLSMSINSSLNSSSLELVSASSVFDNSTNEKDSQESAFVGTTTMKNGVGQVRQIDEDDVVSLYNFLEHYIKEDSERRRCAFFNVSQNASYVAYDREYFSAGLEAVHLSNQNFEIFYDVEIESGCEATLCRLHLLYDPFGNKQRECRRINESTVLYTEDPSYPSPDPITSNYYVTTACSCQEPKDNCNSKICEDADFVNGPDSCAIIFREASCSFCRYEPVLLNVSDSFEPDNGFWGSSYVVKAGCRIAIFIKNETGLFNYKNYTGIDSMITMQFVRYPFPSVISCLCDVQPQFPEEITQWSGKWVLPVALTFGICLVGAALLVAMRLHKKSYKKQNAPYITALIKRFKKGQGFLKDDLVACTYVSDGYVSALQQPYQHKWEINRNDLILDRASVPLGSGHYGRVYTGTLKLCKNNIRVAVKVAKSVSDDDKRLSSLLDEIKILGYIGKHENICSLYGACTKNLEDGKVLVALELCSEGNMKDFLRRNRFKFTEPEKNFNDSTCEIVQYVAVSPAGYALVDSLLKCAEKSGNLTKKWSQTFYNWSMEIATGMEYLSSKQVVHADLAARNILLTDTLTCKISDFGLSKQLSELKNYVRLGNCDLPFRYMALEALSECKFTVQTDVYSYGVLLFEIFSLGEVPFYTISSPSQLIEFLKTNQRLPKPEHCPGEIYSIMQGCWDNDATTRPNFTQIKELMANAL